MTKIIIIYITGQRSHHRPASSSCCRSEVSRCSHGNKVEGPAPPPPAGFYCCSLFRFDLPVMIAPEVPRLPRADSWPAPRAVTPPPPPNRFPPSIEWFRFARNGRFSYKLFSSNVSLSLTRCLESGLSSIRSDSLFINSCFSLILLGLLPPALPRSSLGACGIHSPPSPVSLPGRPPPRLPPSRLSFTYLLVTGVRTPGKCTRVGF